jgi:hypothetical protein
MWLHVQTVNPVWCFDATGGIIRDVLDEKRALLYSAVFHDDETKSIIPAFEFVTTNHTEDNIFKYLAVLRRLFLREIPSSAKYFQIAPIIVTDFSWASINAILDAFNRCNIEQYINWTYDILIKKNGVLKDAMVTIVYLCSTHILKLIVQKTKQVKFGAEQKNNRLKNKTKEEKESENGIKK